MQQREGVIFDGRIMRSTLVHQSNVVNEIKKARGNAGLIVSYLAANLDLEV